MQTIDLPASSVSLRQDGILHVHIKQGAHMTMSEALQTFKAMKVIGGGKKYPVLIDAGEFATIDPDVRVFAAGPEGNIYTIADAIAYYSLAQKLIANFYVSHNAPVVPTLTFSDKDKAIHWLVTFLPETAHK
jgi:hypothetical protein